MKLNDKSKRTDLSTANNLDQRNVTHSQFFKVDLNPKALTVTVFRVPDARRSFQQLPASCLLGT